MDDETLRQIEERAAAATPGPWAHGAAEGGSWACAGDEAIVTLDGREHGQDVADAEFIAHARQDVPALLTEVRRLRAEVADLREQLDAMPEHMAAAEERGAAWALSAALVAFAETEAWNDSRQAVYDLDPAEVCRRARVQP